MVLLDKFGRKWDASWLEEFGEAPQTLDEEEIEPRKIKYNTRDDYLADDIYILERYSSD